MLSLVILALGCKGGGFPATLVISDGSGEKWSIADLQSGQVDRVYDYNAEQYDRCDGGDPEKWCMSFQATPRSGLDGRREVVFAFNPIGSAGAADTEQESTVLAAVDFDSFEQIWSFSRLDFSVNYEQEEPCRWDEADPCAPHPDGNELNRRTCSIFEAHDLVIVSEDASSVTAWVADSRNARVVKVRLDRTNTCAVVEDYVNAALADWDVYITPNSLQRWEDDDGEHLLLTLKSSLEEADFLQEPGNGRGKIVEFVRRDGKWDQLWEFPPESVVGPSFVNAPHGVMRTTGEDGLTYVLFAHSLGMSTDFDAGEGGSISVLRIVDDTPVYLYDAVLTGKDPWTYTRDVTALPDGTFLVAESGCVSGTDCPYETALYRVELPLADAEPAGRTGAFESGGDEQVLLEVEAIGGPWFSSQEMIYSVEVVPW